MWAYRVSVLRSLLFRGPGSPGLPHRWAVHVTKGKNSIGVNPSTCGPYYWCLVSWIPWTNRPQPFMSLFPWVYAPRTRLWPCAGLSWASQGQMLPLLPNKGRWEMEPGWEKRKVGEGLRADSLHHHISSLEFQEVPVFQHIAWPSMILWRYICQGRRIKLILHSKVLARFIYF